MMRQMRENTKIVLWVVVVAFVITIFAVWGLDLQSTSTTQQQSLVGRVNGVEVTPQMYQTIYSQMAQQFRTQAGDLTAAQQEMIRQQAWENIVSNILTSEQIKKLGITVTDEEVLNFLRSTPPPEVQQYFKDQNGNFDYATYQAALNNPETDWTAVEDLARQRIPVIKLNQYLMSQVHVSAADLRRAFAEQKSRMVARYVEFPLDAEDLGDWTPSDEEVKAYYDAHPDSYKDVEKATIEYVRIPIAPTTDDRNALIGVAETAREDAIRSGDFEAEVKSYSEAQTANVGGETGFLGKSQRDPAVMEAVEALKPGEISKPIVTADGIYVVQLIEAKKEKTETRYNLRELYIRLTASAITQDSLATLARTVQENATASSNLEEAARQEGLEVAGAGPFADGFPIPGLGYYPAISRFAFSAKPGEVSTVVSDERNYVVCRLKERIPAASRPLDEVKEGITQALVRERRLTLAKRKADALERSASEPGTTFDAAAAKYGYSVARTDSFTVMSPPSGMMSGAPFARAALSLPLDTVSPPVESGNAVYVLMVVGRTDPNQEEFAAHAAEIRNNLYNQKIQEYVAYWYGHLKDESRIEDLRGTAF